MSTSDSFVPFPGNTRVTLINVWSSSDLRQLRELAEQGTPLKEIAARLRRSESAVRNKAGMQGISLRVPRPPAQQRVQAGRKT